MKTKTIHQKELKLQHSTENPIIHFELQKL